MIRSFLPLATRSLLSVVACSLLSLTGALLASTTWATDFSAPAAIQALQSSDEAAQLAAIGQLAGHPEAAAAAVEPLIASLGDKSAKVRSHAARALGSLGPAAQPAAAALVKLVEDPESAVARQAVRALVKIHPGADVVIPLFVKLLENADPSVRQRVLEALSEAGPAAVPGLIQALGNEQAAYWACLVLRELGPVAKDAVDALVGLLKDKRPEVRREAILALGSMGEAANSAVGPIAAALADPDTQSAATFVLGEIGQIPPEAEQTLRAASKGDDKNLRLVSLWTLAHVHQDDKDLRGEATEQLMTALLDSNEQMRVLAARALAALPPDPATALPAWDRVMKQADAAQLHQALDALAALGPMAVPRLIEILKHKELRPQVAYILGRMGPAAAPATEALAALVGDDNAQVATEAALALAQIGAGAKAAVPQLAAALKKPDCPSAHAIVFALGKIGSSAGSAEPQIRQTMKSSDRALAALAAWSLTRLHPGAADIAKQALPMLLAALADPLTETRLAAAEQLGSLGSLAASALPALQKASGDPEAKVRTAAAHAASAIRQPPAK